MQSSDSFLTKAKNTLGATYKTITTSTPHAILAGALMLSLSHIAYAFIITRVPQTDTVAFFTGKPIDETDFIEGNKGSKVYVIEYSDPECPYCVTLHPTLKQLRTDYKDKVAFVYRHFPLTQIHPNAFDESKAIACAGALKGSQGFYEYIDSLYGYKAANETTQLPAKGKDEIAKNLGLDATAFTACMKDEITNLVVDSSINDGVQAGVQGTPSTFIVTETRQGYEVVAMLDGARPYQYIQAAIEEALSR